MVWILVLGIIAIVVLAYFWPRQREKREKGKLRQEIRRKMRVDEARADEYIEDMKGRLKNKYPGKSEQWYLEKIMSDLERGR